MEKLNCILLIDDDETTNYLTARLIKRLNITEQVLVAKNGREGLSELMQFTVRHGRPPGLILLDINMPVMDGFEFMQAYEQLDLAHKTEVRIAILTTSSNPTDVQKMTALGVQSYITKPLKPETLQDLLK